MTGRKGPLAPTTTSWGRHALARLDELWTMLGLPTDDPVARRVHAQLLAPVELLLARPSKSFRASLVRHAWRAAGGRRHADVCPPLLPSLIEWIHAGSLIVDDVEDGSRHRRGGPAVHCEFGEAHAINAGTWLYFWAQECVHALPLPEATRYALARRVGRALVAGHAGQALDLGQRLADIPRAEIEPAVAHTSRLKTGSFMGLAAAAGAMAAGAPDAEVEALEAFGCSLGDALQRFDDLGNLLGHRDPDRRFEDLEAGRLTWVWAWLARGADDTLWRTLLREGVAVADGRAEAESLAARLREHVEAAGRACARACLEDALTTLREALPKGADVAGFVTEMARLEISYG